MWVEPGLQSGLDLKSVCKQVAKFVSGLSVACSNSD